MQFTLRVIALTRTGMGRKCPCNKWRSRVARERHNVAAKTNDNSFLDTVFALLFY